MAVVVESYPTSQASVSVTEAHQPKKIEFKKLIIAIIDHPMVRSLKEGVLWTYFGYAAVAQSLVDRISPDLVMKFVGSPLTHENLPIPLHQFTPAEQIIGHSSIPRAKIPSGREKIKSWERPVDFDSSGNLIPPSK